MAEQSWPQASHADERIACSFCDCLQQKTNLPEGATAHCLNCDEVLYQNRAHSLQRTISFCLTGIACLALGLFFPFLTMAELGVQNSVAVGGAIHVLWTNHGEVMALAVGAFAIVIPVFLICSLLYVAVPLLFERALPGTVRIFRWVLFFKTWAMVEVFFLGAIVSLIKLVKLADIELGIGFWAMGGLMLALAGAIGNVDRMEFWDRIESANEKRLRGRKG